MRSCKSGCCLIDAAQQTPVLATAGIPRADATVKGPWQLFAVPTMTEEELNDVCRTKSRGHLDFSLTATLRHHADDRLERSFTLRFRWAANIHTPGSCHAPSLCRVDPGPLFQP